MARKQATRKPSKVEQMSDFDRRWNINRFPNTNIARDPEPHELAQKRREMKELGLA